MPYIVYGVKYIDLVSLALFLQVTFIAFILHIQRIVTIDGIQADWVSQGSSARYFDKWVNFSLLDDTYRQWTGFLIFLATMKFVILFRCARL